MKKLTLAATLIMLCGTPVLAQSASNTTQGGFDGRQPRKLNPLPRGIHWPERLQHHSR